MAIDDQRINAFVGVSKIRQAIAAIVRQAGFTIAWVKEQDDMPERWAFWLKLNPQLKQLFGTTREVLLYTVEHREFQARTVSQAAEILNSERPRLCEDFAIIFAADPKTPQYVAETSDKLNTIFVGISLQEISWYAPIGPNNFLRFLQGRLFSKDLYWISTAITSPNAFFGRRSLHAQMVEQLRQGSSHVGLFGLRKMGKTSLLFRIADSIKQGQDAFIAHVDIQRIDSINPTAEYFLWSLGEALHDANHALRRITGLRLFGRFEIFSDVGDPKKVWELFDHDVKLILKTSRRKLTFLLDEIELMSPHTPGSQWGDSFVRAWRLLRGIEQQHPGRLSYFVTGTNPSCIETNQLNKVENPAYNYFSKQYLPPLSDVECKELLTQLGSQVGLDWTPEALDRLIEHVGGHPFLLRAYGSTIHKALLPRLNVRSVTKEVVEGNLQAFMGQVNSTLSQMIEVLNDNYPNEFYLLETLALGRIGEFRELAMAFPNDTLHLVGYGLIGSDFTSSSIEVEVLQTWMQRRQRARVSPNAQQMRASALHPGDILEGHEILSSIGRPGGFAQVYKAKNASGAVVAVKVFDNASLASLEREVDALDSVRHPNVVEIYDHGKTASGLVYLVMEYLNGQTLTEKCERSVRLSVDGAVSVLAGLLSALIALHPDDESLEGLRKKDDLTTDELRRLTQVRHGYVHRDIKPENVLLVPGRGPVLIDFNIAVRISTPIRTLSSTPGYLPPDGVGGGVVEGWSVDVDLFQLGLTVMQVAVGIPYNGSNLQDLRHVVAGELSGPLCTVLLKLTEHYREDRYLSARAALRDLQKK